QSDHEADNVLGAHKRCPARTAIVKRMNETTVTSTKIRSATSGPSARFPGPRLLSDYRAHKQPNRLHAFNTRSGPIFTGFLHETNSVYFGEQGVSNLEDADG